MVRDIIAVLFTDSWQLKRSWEVGDGESMKMNLRHNKRWMRFRGVSGRLQTDEDDEEDDEDKNFPRWTARGQLVPSYLPT